MSKIIIDICQYLDLGFLQIGFLQIDLGCLSSMELYNTFMHPINTSLYKTIILLVPKCLYLYSILIPYGTKILQGIKFYGFTVVGRIAKLKSNNFYYCVAKILSCFNNRKIRQSFLIQ